MKSLPLLHINSQSSRLTPVRDGMGCLISLFGPDGAGKSTHARLLAEYLDMRGTNTNITWIKSYHTAAYLVSRIFERINPELVEKNPVGTIIRLRPITERKLTRIAWAWLELLSLLPLVFLKVLRPIARGEIVITERFIPDSIASIAYSIGDPGFPERAPARIMLRLIPKDSLLIHLDVGHAEVLNRRGKIADSREFHNFQTHIFHQLASKLEAERIDTSTSPIRDTALKIREMGSHWIARLED